MFLMNEIFTPLFLTIFLIVEYWFLLEKAGEKGWKALIPFYGDYTICKIAKKEKIFWWKLGVVGAIFITLALLIEASIVNFMGFRFIRNALSFDYVLYSLMLVVECVLLIVLDIKQSIAIAKVFGKSTGFGAGIAFLEPIFIGILAFDENAKYLMEKDEIKEDVKNEFIEKAVEEAHMPIIKEIAQEEKVIVEEVIEEIAEVKEDEVIENIE